MFERGMIMGTAFAPTKVTVAGFSSDFTATMLSPALVSRSEEHTSELQSQSNLVCRLLLEKKKNAEMTLIVVPYTTDTRPTTPKLRPHRASIASIIQPEQERMISPSVNRPTQTTTIGATTL